MLRARNAFRVAKRLSEVVPSVTLALEARAKKMKAEGRDVISFAAGEPDFDTPAPIKEAAVRALAEGFTKYTPAQGTLELRQAIAAKLMRDNGLQYSPEEIVASCGAKHSLYNIFQVLVDEGDEVLIPSPYWLSYPEMVRLAGGKPVFVPTAYESGYKASPAELERHMSPRTKILILNSPSNPTGTVYSPEEIKALAGFVKEHGLLTVSDEIYEKLVYDGLQHFSIAAVDEETKNLTITVNGHSKAYAMTGWRIGYCACRKEIAQAIANLQSHSTSNPTSFAQRGAEAALGPGQGEVERMRKAFEKRRDLIFEEARKIPGLRPLRPQGAFYLFCGIPKKTGIGSMGFCEKLLDTKLVSCVPGRPFGSDDSIRLSFATSEDKIVKGIARIREFVESL